MAGVSPRPWPLRACGSRYSAAAPAAQRISPPASVRPFGTWQGSDPGRGRCGPRMRRMSGEPDLSIVVTVLNEERTIDELYERTVAAVNGRPFELVVVDDGSSDATFERLRALHERDPRVRAIRLARNFGQHPAMHAGFARA